MTIEIRTVIVGSTFEETPEGLFRIDRIRRACGAMNELASDPLDVYNDAMPIVEEG